MRGRAVVLALCSLLLAPSLLCAADGDLDPSFGGTGVVTMPFSDVVQDAGGLALQADGMIVAAGRVASSYGALGSLALARYAADGTPDPAFGSGGLVTTTLTGEEPWNVIVHPDGALYVLRVGGGDILLARFTSTGDLDLTFGTGGVVTTDCGGSEGVGARGDYLVVQPDGRLVVGVSSTSGPIPSACLVRYAADGSLDGSFGSGGIALVPGFIVTDLALQADGGILVAGATTMTPEPLAFAVLRVLADGTVAPGFGAGGLALAEDYTLAYAVAAQPDGRVAALSRSPMTLDLALLRYRADGSRDTSFGDDGVVTTTIVGSAESYDPIDLAIQGDGTIVVGCTGETSTGPPIGVFEHFAFLRYTSNGTLDSAYGSAGLAEPGVGGAITSLRMQPDGKAVALGSPISTPLGAEWNIARTVGFSHRCPAPPALGCKVTLAPQAASFKVRNVAPPSKKNQLQWKWKGDATMLADFGDPIGGDDYALCVYDESGMGATLLSSAIVPGGGTCKAKPCWKPLGTTGLAFSESRRVVYGIGSLKLKAGIAGKAQIQVKAQGAWLVAPSLPLGLPTRVQLVSEGGTCWEAVYSAPNASKNDGVQFQGKSD